MDCMVQGKRVEIRLSPAQVAAADEWRRKQPDIPPRAEAIVRLMQAALDAEEKEGEAGGEEMKMIAIKFQPTLWNREYADKARLRQFRRAVKEGNKPSRWYYDNPKDKGSAYRRRYIAALEVAAGIIENSPCEQLAAFARDFIADAKGQLPKTLAAWVKGMPEVKKEKNIGWHQAKARQGQRR